VTGLRSYIAVKDGFAVDPQLSSCATVVRENLGGIHQDGTKLSEGDVIPYVSQLHALIKRVPSSFTSVYPKKIMLRFMPNVSQTSAGERAIKTFTQHTYTVTPNIDRMGYRLSGEVIQTESSGIISQGISLGAIQVPKDGQPIVLMRDRQTMGGYPLLGCVSGLDMGKLAQSLPGTELSFVPISVEEAEAELIVHKNFFGV
jgi:allophanate hydrolase subunit 2